MRPKFRSKQEVTVRAPLEKVWAFSMDLTRIPDFHPQVSKVDVASESGMRETGGLYRCHMVGGNHTCVEKDIEIIPMEKIVTVLPEDTLGISRLLPDYVVETTFSKISGEETRMAISHYYSTATVRAKLLSVVIRWKLGRQTQSMLVAAKETIERER